MPFAPFEVTTPHIVYAALGGFVCLFGMFSLLLREKLYIGEANWAFIFGVIIGPYGAGIFDPRSWGKDENTTNLITLEFTRIVLAVGVFAIGVELPKAYMKRHWRSLLFLLGPVMTWGWLVSAGLIYALIPKLNFLSSLAIAACLTPTDPILAAAIIGGRYANKHVPAHIRHLLAAESGCNDGAAFPFLFLALYLTIDEGHVGSAIRDWFLILWLYQVILGAVLGAVMGIGFRRLMKFCESRDLIDRHSYLAQYLSLALLTTGVTTLLGSDDLLAAFACGTAFAWDGFFNRQTEQTVFSSVIDLLFNIASFVFVGAWMPFGSFTNHELSIEVWRLIVIAILVLLLRRLPIIMALYRWIPDIKTAREAVFSGHFGPMGIGAVFISTLAVEVLHKAEKHDHWHPSPQAEILIHSIQPITAFMVLCSIVIHGMSIPSFSLGRRVHSVSRTWSRHTTTAGGAGSTGPTGLPEWAGQVPVVERGGDGIIINRDGDEKVLDLEKGESDDTKRMDMYQSPKEPGTPAGDNAPDGMEIISEWQEGPHRVIERRAGPGEEVEVEVIGHHGTPHSSSEIFKGPKTHIRKDIDAHLESLKETVEHALTPIRSHTPLGHSSHHLHSQNAQASGSGSSSSSASNHNDTRSKPSPPDITLNSDDEDDEGWASDDQSNPASAPKGQRPRSGSGSNTHGIRFRALPKPSGMKKRRNSMRRTVVSPISPRSPASEDDRGRVGNRRVENVRAEALSPRSRDASPSRSIRFLDTVVSRPGTPPAQ